jgi:DNA primase
VRKHVPLKSVASLYTQLKPENSRLVGRCPFHPDRGMSFAVYPDLNAYSCAVCGARGDNLMFVMNQESLRFEQALEALERFQITGELYGTS